VEWLSKVAGIAQPEAAQVIASFGVPVQQILAANPGTPRCLLGIAAVLCMRPDVAIYSTVGLDPSGCLAVHRFVALNSKGLAAVHVSLPTFFGNGSARPRFCPENSQCINLTSDSPDEGTAEGQKAKQGGEADGGDM
jgi:hypothetical protein